MLDTDLQNAPADPEAFKRWRDKEKAEIALAKSKLAGKPGAYPGHLIVPVLIALLIAIIGFLALTLRTSIDTIEQRTLKIESALSSIPPEETKTADTKTTKTQAPAVPDTGLSNALNDIKDQIAATRSQVDAIRNEIADLEKLTSKAKDLAPGGFASDEMLVAQKGLVVKSAARDGSGGGAPRWLATPSHDMLDLLLKVPQGKVPHSLMLTPKHDNQVKSVEIYDRNNKGGAGKVSDCRTENRVLRCKLNVPGPTVLQVIVKTKGDDPLDIVLEPNA